MRRLNDVTGFLYPIIAGMCVGYGWADDKRLLLAIGVILVVLLLFDKLFQLYDEEERRKQWKKRH